MKNYSSQFLNAHRVSYIRKININRSEPLVPDLSLSEVEIIVVKMRRYKSPGSGQIPAELIHAGDMRSINSIIPLGIRKNCLITGGNLFECTFTRRG
jgi:hypothetical protein